MHSSATRRRGAAPSPGRSRLMLATVAGLVVLGGTFAVTQFASAADEDSAACAETASVNANTLRGGADHRNHNRGSRPTRPAQEQPDAPPEQSAPAGEQPPANGDQGGQQGGDQGGGDQGGQQGGDQGGQAPEQPTTPPEECEEGGQGGGQQNQPPAGNNGLDVLGQDCQQSDLAPHDGFQNAPRCVSTAFGEVSASNQNPSLLISRFPQRVRVNAAFQLRVSTRNLVRDRFLGAAAGGYYLESSFLNDQGIQRGHFHVACRMLNNTRVAPNPDPAPAFFRAVEDGGGSAAPDEVVVDVTGMPNTGTAQCAVWAGDGSHRLPMMQRANQTPAFDIVRIRVTR